VACARACLSDDGEEGLLRLGSACARSPSIAEARRTLGEGARCAVREGQRLIRVVGGIGDEGAACWSGRLGV
jgi:hypothetical protein